MTENKRRIVKSACGQPSPTATCDFTSTKDSIQLFRGFLNSIQSDSTFLSNWLKSIVKIKLSQFFENLPVVKNKRSWIKLAGAR